MMPEDFRHGFRLQHWPRILAFSQHFIVNLNAVTAYRIGLTPVSQKIHMSSISDILALARTRAEQQGVNYSGDVTPLEAHTLLQEAPGTVLVDVRTRAEWDWVGRVPNAIEIEWVEYPEMTRNTHFLTTLLKQVPREAQILFLCRSGVRSRGAASVAIEAGYTAAYNILEGFEGDKDAQNHRGQIGGWRFHGLPWYQG